MIDRGKREVLGIRVDAVDYGAAVQKTIDAARNKSPFAVSALAVHGVMTGVLDRTHRHRLNSFDLIVPDGQPVRWALNLLHRTRLRERVYGPELMLRTCKRAAEEALPVFLYGSKPDVLPSLQQNLVKLYPRLKIAGMRPSRFRRVTPEEQEEIVLEIRSSGAALTFVGLGCPRQEVWAYELHHALSMPILAVGAAFDFHAGKLAQAPNSLQKWGLEWIFRLVNEPRRLWKRYLFLNPLFLTLLACQLVGAYKVDVNNSIQPQDEMLFG